jgi:3-oxoacyl-[acyl-carrier-protein] synthase II
MTERARVVVTGVGVVSGAFVGTSAALGVYLAARGRSAASVAPGAVPGVTIEDGRLGALLADDEARRWSRVSQFAVAAARLALSDARLPREAPLGLVVGTELGDLRSTMQFADGYLRRGPSGVSPLLFPNTVMNAMASAASIALGVREASLTLNVPTVGGELAIARAVSAITTGRLPCALAGGVDDLAPEIVELLTRIGGATDVRGEGATLLLLEPRASAEARGAAILGEITGSAWSALPARAYGVGRAVESRAVAAALAAAGRTPADIGWVYRSGSGDLARDRWEARVLDRALDRRPAIASLAGPIGQHSGLGALRVAAALWTSRSGLIPVDGSPTLERVPRGPGLVHGLGRGGNNVALVIEGP